MPDPAEFYRWQRLEEDVQEMKRSYVSRLELQRDYATRKELSDQGAHRGSRRLEIMIATATIVYTAATVVNIIASVH